MKTKPWSLPYLAGMFDGEGCIRAQETVGRGRPAFSLYVNLGNQYKPAVLAFKRRFGGSMHFNKLSGNIHYWAATGVNALKTLRALLPFLTVKRKQAEVALRWRVHSKGFNKKLTPAEYKERRKIVRTLKRLKHAYR